MNAMMINDLINGLKSIYQDDLLRIILYGSFAKGTNTDESDIDIAILLENPGMRQMQEKLIDFMVNMDLKYDKVFSVVDIDNENFLKWDDVLPFYKNVKTDGIVLWKAA